MVLIHLSTKCRSTTFWKGWNAVLLTNIVNVKRIIAKVLIVAEMKIIKLKELKNTFCSYSYSNIEHIYWAYKNTIYNHLCRQSDKNVQALWILSPSQYLYSMGMLCVPRQFFVFSYIFLGCVVCIFLYFQSYPLIFLSWSLNILYMATQMTFFFFPSSLALSM